MGLFYQQTFDKAEVPSASLDKNSSLSSLDSFPGASSAPISPLFHCQLFRLLK